VVTITGTSKPRADVGVVITMVSMIMPIISARPLQPLPARGADDHHRPVIVGRRRCHGAVTFRTARCAAVRCQRDHLSRRLLPNRGGGSFLMAAACDCQTCGDKPCDWRRLSSSWSGRWRRSVW
jgi:hypothetical protein